MKKFIKNYFLRELSAIKIARQVLRGAFSIDTVLPTLPVSEHKFKDGQLSYILVTLTSVPLPINLNASCNVKELNCIIPNCTLKAKEWYYLKHRKRFKKNNKERTIHAYSAKQIPLCLNHYNLVNSARTRVL